MVALQSYTFYFNNTVEHYDCNLRTHLYPLLCLSERFAPLFSVLILQFLLVSSAFYYCALFCLSRHFAALFSVLIWQMLVVSSAFYTISALLL